MKNLIEKISIKTGLTKLEVTALLFIFASIVTGVGLHFAVIGKNEIQIATNEKSSWELIQKEKKKVGRDQVGASNGSSARSNSKPYKVHLNRGQIKDYAQIPGLPRSLAVLIVEKRVDSLYTDFYDLISRLDEAGIYYIDTLRSWVIE